MFLLTKRKAPSSKSDVEREYRLLAHQKMFDGFLDTRIRLENYNRDVCVNLYNISELSETPYRISCVYTASNPAYWEQVANLHQRISGETRVFPAIGMMPGFVEKAPKDWERMLKYHLTMNPKMLIGEIGLDLTPETASVVVAQQKDLLHKQLKMAAFWGRSVLLSVAHAVPELIDVLQKSEKLPPAMVLSAAHVPYQLLPELQRFDHLYYAFSPYVMDSRGYHERRVLRKTPLNRILLESRPQTAHCNSASLPYVANFIAKNLRIERKQLYAALLQNSQHILGD